MDIIFKRYKYGFEMVFMVFVIFFVWGILGFGFWVSGLGWIFSRKVREDRRVVV
jgi:hypothetical protein